LTSTYLEILQVLTTNSEQTVLGGLASDGVYKVWVIFPTNMAVGRTRAVLKSGALHNENFVVIALNVFNNRTRTISCVSDELKAMSCTHKSWVRESEENGPQADLTLDGKYFRGKWYTTYMWHLFLTSKNLYFPLTLSSAQAEFREALSEFV
jgi:hypothetical protein